MARRSWPPDEMAAVDRIRIAREKIERLIEHLIGVITLHESNRIIVYSDQLSRQIPRSYAANAFNTFQHTGLFLELIRLCAIWDKAGEHRESIPTIIRLIDRPDVLSALKAEIEAQWGRKRIQPSDDPHLGEMIVRSERRFGKSQGKKIISRLRYSIRQAENIEKSEKLAKIVNFRDKHLAHALAMTYREAQGDIVAPPKRGDERTILRASTTIVHNLYLGISNADFCFDDSYKIARNNATALWHNCSFTVSR